MIKSLVRQFFLLAMVCVLAACTPVEQTYRPEASSSVQLTADVFITSDGAALPYRSWIPKRKAGAVLIALHGFNDYSRAFVAAGEYLSRRGVAVYAYDQRGFGGAPQIGIWGGQQNFISDLAAWMRHVRQRYPDRPVYILGESMGGAVAINAVASPSFPAPDGVILVAPAVWGGEAMNPFYRFMATASAHLMPSYKMTGSDLKIQPTDNMALLEQMGVDPLIIKATRLDAMYGLMQLMDGAVEKLSHVNVPVLLLYGGKDEVIPEAVIWQAASFLGKNSSCIYYPDGYHMLLRDIKGYVVMKNIHEWVLKTPGNNSTSDCNTMKNRVVTKR